MARMMSSTSVLLRRKPARQRQHNKLFILLLTVSMSAVLQIIALAVPTTTIPSTILLLGLGLPTVVNAVWYSEICHTGPRYKVRIDETTGKVVPVAPFQTTTGGSGSGSGLDSNGGIFYDTNNVMPETIKINNTSNSTIDDYVSVGDDNSDRRVLRSRQIWRDFGDGTDDDNDEESYSYDALVVKSSRSRSVGVLGEIITEEVEPDPTVSAEFAKRFLLQSQQQQQQEEHEEFDDDSSLLRRFLQQMQPTQMSPQQQLEQDIEDLLDNDGLLEGEFFVKPCLCPGSRWTFPTTTTNGEGEGGYDPSSSAANGNNSTTELVGGNDETNTPSSSFIKGPHSRNSNPGYNNYGQHTNGNYYYVPDNLENGDLYLCQVSAMYCGVPMDNGSTGNDIVVKCYAQNMRHIIARNAWPLILLWYFGLAMICCCTVHGRTAGDYVQDRFTYYITKYICCCCFNSFSNTNTNRSNNNDNNNEQEQEHEQEHYEYDFNSRMLNRMIDDQEQEYGRRPTPSPIPDNDDDDDEQQQQSQSPTTRQQRRPWYYTSRRRNFERSLLSQVQWIWRHQEYLHEIQRRTDGLPPPQLKLKTKRFCMTTTTSGSRGIGFGTMPIPTPIPTTLEDTVDIPNTNDDTPTTTPTFNNNTTNDNTAPSTMMTMESSATASATITTDTINKNKEDDDDDDDTTPPDEDGDDDDEQQEFVTLDLGIKAQDRDDPQDDDGDDDDDEKDRTNKSCSLHNDDDDDDQADNNDNDSLEEPTCTICFCPFEEGDKIGDLICRHEFHVECLKGWAQRKNACPLCNVRLGRPERPSPITNASTSTSLQSPTIQSSLSLSLASSLSTSLALSSLREQTSRTTTANNSNNNDSNNIDSTSSTPSSTTTATTGGGGGGGLMQRISGLGRRNGSNNNSRNNNNGNASNTGAGTGTGEIQMSNRVGIIASFSAADDITTAYSNPR